MSDASMSDLGQPTPTALSAPFWEATARHQLVIQRCRQDGHFEWTPQLACSRCHSESLEWSLVSGAGIVYSFSVVMRPATPDLSVPYIVAIVELAEGPRMLTRLRNVAPNEVRISMPVLVAFEDRNDLALYTFGPVLT
jgi:uncharacterized protein